jgi:hypothetical protein
MSRKPNPKSVPAMTEAQLEEVLALQEAAVQGATTEAEPEAATEFVGPPAPIEVSVEWQPREKYATTVSNAIARADASAATPAGAVVAASVPVLLSIGNPIARAGTARAAALAALQAHIGQPRAVVLAAVATAEREWHKRENRTPGNLAPAGWLRENGVFEVRFGPAPAVAEAAEATEEA